MRWLLAGLLLCLGGVFGQANRKPATSLKSLKLAEFRKQVESYVARPAEFMARPKLSKLEQSVPMLACSALNFAVMFSLVEKDKAKASNWMAASRHFETRGEALLGADGVYVAKSGESVSRELSKSPPSGQHGAVCFGLDKPAFARLLGKADPAQELTATYARAWTQWKKWGAPSRQIWEDLALPGAR